MTDSRGKYSRALAPMASKEEDLEEMETPYSHLSAKPFSLPVNTTNMYQLKPLKDPDAEEFPPTRNPSEIGDDDSSLPGEKPSHPYPKPSLDPKFHGEYPPSSIPEIPFGLGPTPEVPDVNVYQHKKTVAQGMMDIALLSANANQMRYVLESGGNHPYYYVSITLIGISLLLQVAVGVGLILNSRYNVSYETSMRKANRINNYTVLAIFLITVMNVFISAFGIASVSSPAFPPSPRIEEGGGPEIELRD
ncbi:uncharacterized protein LOC113204971 isoform X3 [Frankliniella occidentalis]|uniref:Uncharacterized protein LOC113204971 isoform X3 n=1 Tax=Frankliniella occidentalis TaxID=133901 RepID=A0A9C6UCT8_FRAOC|nr:uncharacterized protein LOC113204971 isoform X3 [Frankliniella occidentalis]